MSDQQQAGQVRNMRDDMPLTAKWVDARRAEFGREWVHDCVRRAIAGEAGWFYAIENGHVLGMPFGTMDAALAQWEQFAVLAGVEFAAFIARPQQGGADGAH